MSLSDSERETLMLLEIEKARRTYEEALALKEKGFWNGVASRLYYAAFHAVSALFIHDKREVNTHKGSHGMFMNPMSSSIDWNPRNS